MTPVFDFTRILISLYYPAAFLTLHPLSEGVKKISSVTGAGLDVQYGFTDDLMVEGNYSLNFSLKSRSVVLSGWELGARYYLFGGAGEATYSGIHSAYLSPKASFFLSGALEGRSFDFSDSNKPRDSVYVGTPLSFDTTGSYLGVNGGAGLEMLLWSPHLRIGSGATVGRSASVSTAFFVVELVIRAWVGYQL